MARKPWLVKKNLEEVYNLPYIHTDNDVVTYYKDKGYDVARRTISDARSKFGIPAKSKKDIMEVQFTEENLDYDEIWDLVLQMQEAMKGIRRDRREAIFDFNRDEPIAIAFMGDVHMGDVGTDYKQLLEDVELIKNTENLYLVTGGDYINNFMKRNRNYNEYEVFQPRMQWKMAEWFFSELEDSFLAVATGNHDNWAEELTQFDALYAILKRLNIVYTKHGAKLTLNMPGHSYTIAFKHNTRSAGGLNPTAGVKQMVRYEYDADVAALFDTHVGAVEEFIHEGQWRVAIRTGTYKTDDHWGHGAGFDDNVRVCVPVVVFHPQERFFMSARSLQQGVELLSYARDAYARGTFGVEPQKTHLI